MTPLIYRRSRLVAAVLTALIAALIVVVLCVSSMGWDSSRLAENAVADTAMTEEEDVFLEPELLETGDNSPVPADEAAPVPTGEPEQAETPVERPVAKADNPRHNAETERLVSSKAESPVKTVRPSARDEEEALVSSKMKNKFNAKNGRSDGRGTQAGSGGSGSGAAGRLRGRTFLGCPEPKVEVPRSVSIVVNVTVDAEGRVTAASFGSDSGPGAGNTRLREACVRQSRKARWSAKEGAPPARGTLTWHLLPR